MARGFFGRLVAPFRQMPRALPIATPIASPIATPIGIPISQAIADRLTNIDATDLLARPGDFRPLQTAKSLDRTNPDPIWITRWQNSTSPPEEAPWVKGFRWWEALVHFQTWGPDPLYRIDFLWADHRHAYYGIPYSVWHQFINWGGSVGEWFHDNILVPGWNGKTVRGSRYPDFEL